MESNSNGGGGSSGSCTTTAQASYCGSERGKDETADLEQLVGRVVRVNVEGFSRLIVGFL